MLTWVSTGGGDANSVVVVGIIYTGVAGTVVNTHNVVQSLLLYVSFAVPAAGVLVVAQVP